MTIKKIIETGLYYVDEEGNERFLSFEKCNENWIDYRRRKGKVENVELLKNDRCVGQRETDIHNSYIEFFTKPFTRFSFERPLQKEEYLDILLTIMKFGWTIIDWS